MSTGFNQFVNKATPVYFAPTEDSQLENEGQQAPLFRERWTDQTNVFLTGDGNNQVNPQANTNEYNIGGGPYNGRYNNKFYLDRMKKLMPTFAQTNKYATNINPRNDTILFKMGPASIKPNVIYTARIQNYNYTRMTTDWCDLPVTTPATYNSVNLASNWAPPIANVRGDPADGLVDHLLSALNNAIGDDGIPYSPTLQGQWKSYFSNGNILTRTVAAGGDTWISSYRYRNTGTGENLLAGDAKYGMLYCELAGSPNVNVAFTFTGGNTFERGQHCWGCEPITQPNLIRYQYPFGACQFQYSRWIDIVSPELVQYSKFKNQGSAVTAGLLVRLYNDSTQKIGCENTFFTGEQQQINMRKDESLSFITVKLLDEYGDLYYIPQGAVNIDPADIRIEPETWPNNQGVTLGFIAQL